jgi:hypothetical protein
MRRLAATIFIVAATSLPFAGMASAANSVGTLSVQKSVSWCC